MTGQQLRNSILQLAIQGKLVAQDSKDEPASALLERVAKERAARPGKRKASRSRIERRPDGTFEVFPDGSEKDISDEIPFDIPESWEWVRLELLFSIMTGKRDANFGSPDGIYPFFTCGKDPIRCHSYSFDGEAILMAGNGDISNISLYIGKFEAYQRTYVLQPYVPGYLNYVYYHIKSNWVSYNKEKVYGSAIPYIRLSNIKDYIVAFPPHQEQQRIVAKIESLLPLVERYGRKEEELNQLNEALPKRLRQSLLQAAIEGKLVAQDPKEEPASALLERVAKERAALPGKRKAAPPSRIERRPDGHFYESLDGSTPVCIDDELPFEIPDSWEWVRGRDIFLPIENRVPDQNFTYIDIDAINNKEHIIENPKELSFKSAPSRARRVIRKNDVLFSLVRPYLENIALVTEDGDNLIASTGFFVARSAQGIDYRYTFYLLTSPYVVQGLNTYMKGDNSPSIHGTHVENYLYPLPPATEQHRIADALERQLKQLDILRGTVPRHRLQKSIRT